MFFNSPQSLRTVYHGGYFPRFGSGLVFGWLLAAVVGFSACGSPETLLIAGPTTVEVGATIQLTATHDSDKTGPLNVTNSAFWYTTNSDVLTVGSNTGTVMGISGGLARVRVNYAGLESGYDIAVTGGALSLSVSGPPTILVGNTAPLSALFVGANGLPQDVTASAFWYPSDSTLVAVNSLTGVVTGRGSGPAKVFAEYNGLTASHDISSAFAAQGTVAAPVNIGTGTATIQSQVATGSSYYYAGLNAGWSNIFLENPTANVELSVWGSADFVTNLIGQSANAGAANEALLVACNAPCTGYVEVLNPAPTVPGAAYSLGVSFVRNFQPAGALPPGQPVGIGTAPLTGFLGETGPGNLPGQPSYFVVNFDTSPATWTITLTNIPADRDLDLEVYDNPNFVHAPAAQNLLGSSAVRAGGGTESVTLPSCSAPCAFFIKVVPWTGPPSFFDIDVN